MATTVGEIMSTSLLLVEPTTTVAEAATMMGERRTGSCLVTAGGDLVGIFTERDIILALGQHFDAATHPVSEWMTADPVCVLPATHATEALQLMLDRGFRHLPVLEDGRLLGIVSLRDLSAVSLEPPESS